MASKTERDAWERFIAYIRDAMPALDGSLPVALICLPARNAGDGFDVDPHGQGRILWPKDVPIEERGPLLDRLAEPYRRGTVTR